MIPVQQTNTRFAEGDCFRACLASILELPAETVPDFYNADPVYWFGHASAWLRERGMRLVWVDQAIAPFVAPIDGIYHIKVGRTNRSAELHAVVGLGLDTVHDPFPGGVGLVEVKEFFFIHGFESEPV